MSTSMELGGKMLEQPRDVPTTFTSSSTRRILWIAVVTLVFLLVALLAVVFALAVALGVEQADSSSSAAAAPVCLTPDCAQLSALVLSGLDETIEPCDNFYNFSCGNWAQNTIIPDGRLV